MLKIEPILGFINSLSDWPAMFDYDISDINNGSLTNSTSANTTDSFSTPSIARNGSEFRRSDEEWKELRNIMIKLRKYGTAGLVRLTNINTNMGNRLEVSNRFGTL